MFTRRSYATFAVASLLVLANLPQGHHNTRSFLTGWGAGICSVVFLWAMGRLLND